VQSAATLQAFVHCWFWQVLKFAQLWQMLVPSPQALLVVPGWQLEPSQQPPTQVRPPAHATVH
jgi:hypothetical protein